MPLETAVYIDTLDPAQPVGDDALAYVNLHLQLIKQVLQDTFPNITGPVTQTQAQLNVPYTTGMIINWWGTLPNIPVGWALCDGTNGTPDLRGKFVAGAGGAIASGTAGGFADAFLPSHTHTGTSGGQSASHTHAVTASETSMSAEHRHFIGAMENGGNQQGTTAFTTFNLWHSQGGGNFEYYSANDVTTEANGGLSSWDGAHTHTVSVTVGNASGDHTHNITVAATGGDGAGKNIPPYVGLYFIMKI